MVAATKGTRMNTKALAAVACLWVPMAASAADGSDNTAKLDSLSQKFEKILATQGISFGGQLRGEFGASMLSGASENSARRNDEQIGFTEVDFDLRARPNTVTQARAVFRMHLDDASFFGAPYSPFETRWLSLDGSTPEGIFYYHVGSLLQKWSPLTIWSPDPTFIYTPRIFAQQQKQAMDERFLGNNNRKLDGANLGIRAAVPSVAIDSFNVGLLAGKLLTAAPIGSPASQFTSKSNTSMDGTTGYPDTLANFDRWAFGGRGTVTFLKAFDLGANVLAVKDLKSTFGTIDTGAENRVPRDSLAQSGLIYSVQLGADIANFLHNDNLVLGLNAEIASSSWDYFGSRDTLNGAYVGPKTKTTSGIAIDATLKGGWQTKDWRASLSAGYLQVDSAYRSDLAQTPVFNPANGRIYNSEQDLVSTSGVNTGLLHYNTFDALYHSVHHWIAEDKNEYTKAPYDKIAYSNYVAGWANYSLGAWTGATADAAKANATAQALAVATPNTVTSKAAAAAKLALYQTVLQDAPFDRDLQFVLPGGEATPNRVGPKVGFDASFLNGGVEATGNGYFLSEAKGTVLDSIDDSIGKKATFQQVQAGVKFRLDRFVPGWNTLLHPKNPIPLEISLSGGQSTAKGGASLDYNSTELAASVYVGVLPRLSLLGGYQAIIGLDNTIAIVSKNMTDLAGGLEFKIQEGAYFLAMYNLIKTEYPNAPEYNFDQSIWSTKISVSF
jgi:hypothetical protein